MSCYKLLVASKRNLIAIQVALPNDSVSVWKLLWSDSDFWSFLRKKKDSRNFKLALLFLFPTLKNKVAYLEVCEKGPGYAPVVFPDIFEDINECKDFPDICKNGVCVNTDGSFRCECELGFTLDETGHSCVGRYS